MKDKKQLFYFPKPGSKFNYLLIFIFCSLMRKLIPRFIEKMSGNGYNDREDLETINFNKNRCYFDLLSNFIADFLAGIMILINKCRYKTSNNVPIQNPKTKQEIKSRFYFYLPIIAIIDFIAQLCLFLFSFIITKGKLLEEEVVKEENLYFVVLIDIISRYGFSRFFLSGHFYKHHIVSIIITCIGFIPLTIKNIIDLKLIENNKITYIYLVLFIFMTIIYSMEDVLNKICLNQLILRPYELMFYKSLFQILLVFLLTIYLILFNNLIEYIGNSFNFYRVIYRFSFIISNIFRTWSLITIIELLSPNHLSVLKSSEFAVLFIFISLFNSFYNDFKGDNYFYIFGSLCCVISIIGSAIHNEIFIINKFGLLECTDFYKTELKDFSDIDDDLEDTSIDKNDQTLDSFLGDSIDGD